MTLFTSETVFLPIYGLLLSMKEFWLVHSDGGSPILNSGPHRSER